VISIAIVFVRQFDTRFYFNVVKMQLRLISDNSTFALFYDDKTERNEIVERVSFTLLEQLNDVATTEFDTGNAASY